MPVPVVPADPAWPTVAAADRRADPFDPDASARSELDRQVRAVVDLGLATLHGWTAADLSAAVEPLHRVVDDLPESTVPPQDHVPFVLVLDGGTTRANAAVAATRRGPRPGVSVIDDDELATYLPLPDAVAPAAPYLLTDVDTGSEFCGVPPEQALVTVRRRGRVPLTIAEGLALVALRPDMLRPNRCFSLLGSRARNQRVPAVWISARAPKLGWCWDRNPHTWLGAASAGARVPAG